MRTMFPQPQGQRRSSGSITRSSRGRSLGRARVRAADRDRTSCEPRSVTPAPPAPRASRTSEIAVSTSSKASSIWSGDSFSELGPDHARRSSRARCSSRALSAASSALRARRSAFSASRCSRAARSAARASACASTAARSSGPRPSRSAGSRRVVNRPGFPGGGLVWRSTPPWRRPPAARSSAPRPRRAGRARWGRDAGGGRARAPIRCFARTFGSGVASPTASRPRPGPRLRIASVLRSPITVSAGASSSEPPDLRPPTCAHAGRDAGLGEALRAPEGAGPAAPRPSARPAPRARRGPARVGGLLERAQPEARGGAPAHPPGPRCAARRRRSQRPCGQSPAGPPRGACPRGGGGEGADPRPVRCGPGAGAGNGRLARSGEPGAAGSGTVVLTAPPRAPRAPRCPMARIRRSTVRAGRARPPRARAAAGARMGVLRGRPFPGAARAREPPAWFPACTRAIPGRRPASRRARAEARAGSRLLARWARYVDGAIGSRRQTRAPRPDRGIGSTP